MSISAPRWTRIGQVFSSAKEIEPSEREAFVRKECAGDADLEREVFRLLELDDRAGSFLEQPAASIQMAGPLLTEGDMLADRYRILGLIGRGGMSDVYEAHDDVIGDVVALKVARPGLEPIHALEARWRREVLLARKVSHSGVCRVHDVAIHRQDGRELLLLTMERLNGESLESRMQRHGARLEEVLDLARQVGAALDAAHGEGVLHRDIKPDNILLEPRGEGRIRAVLTDFGLARHAAPDAGSPVTEAGFLAGTPGYLAPELLRGDPPSIRSDLYAFAVVIHNLLVGVTPVLDRRVSAVFARATSPDPSARYGSAHTFVDALTSATTGGPSRWLRFAKRKEALVGGVVILVLALSVFLFRLYQQATPTVSVASQILLTEMVNGTDDDDFEGATEVLRSQLDQSPHFELLERERVRDVLTRMARPPDSVLTPEVAREVAMREGVPLVVYSALTRLGADYVLNVKLEQVGARPSFARRTWTQTFSAPAKSALFETMHGAAVWIRQMVGEVPSSLEAQDRASSETTTSSWEALKLFKQANDLSAAGRPHDATLVLEQAIHIDPEFAMAQARLGDILISLRRDKEGYPAWQRAIELANRRRLTSREALRIPGQYYDDTGDLAEAEKAYRTYWIHYPNDFYANFFLGGVLIELNRASEAVPLLEKAQTLRPKGVVATVHLARTRLDLRRVKDVETTIAQLDGLGAEADGWARWLRALSIFITGDLDRAMEVLEPLKTAADPQWRSRAYTLKASWLSEAGLDQQALAELREGIDFDSTQGFRDRLADKWLHVAELECRQKDAAAVASAQRALDTANNVRRTVRAANILVRAGEKVAAERLLASLDEFPQVPKTIAARHRLLGELYLGEDDASLAVNAFESNATRAVNAFDQGLAGARWSESRLPLIPALIRAGDVSRARRELWMVVEHPVAIYAGPEPQAPGLWREAIVQLTTLVARRDPDEAEKLRQRFARILRGKTTIAAPTAQSPR